jgi:phosphoglycerol transferase MdoB-like AlkP superfamily enzyme
MNQSSVWFSDKRILNQAAENPVWVFGQSLLEDPRQELEKIYVSGNPGVARKWCDSLYQDSGQTNFVLNQPRPNIILIIWESLSSKVSGCTSGRAPSTPHLDQIARSGLLFNQIYANGDRSDKGLVSILSAQPAFGKVSLMSHPNISARFDFLNQRLEKLGYSSLYLYGGELEFANMKSYLLNAGFDKLCGKDAFPSDQWNSKWGAHDEFLFQRQLMEADLAHQPFFHTLFTLSSHEPFEIPGREHPPFSNQDSLFCRAHRYTDACLGSWVEKASQKPWWKNSLVIVLADHGHSLPGNSEESDPEKFRIPMVWFGPALKKSGLISRMGNQTDLFATLCQQLNDHQKLPAFSKNLLSDGSRDFAFFAFREGCSFLRPSINKTAFDQHRENNEAEFFREAAYFSAFH